MWEGSWQADAPTGGGDQRRVSRNSSVLARPNHERIPHLLNRGSTATQHLAHSGDVISLQRRLGHSGLDMTSRYVHLASAQLAAIQERVTPMGKVKVKAMRRLKRK